MTHPDYITAFQSRLATTALGNYPFMRDSLEEAFRACSVPCKVRVAYYSWIKADRNRIRISNVSAFGNFLESSAYADTQNSAKSPKISKPRVTRAKARVISASHAIPAPVQPVSVTPTEELAQKRVADITEIGYIPTKDPDFVPWGDYSTVLSLVQSGCFYPLYISGLSGNGKTMMVEQACAHAGREFIRVQISPETDETDLIGGYQLIDGNTVFHKGPVIRAMERGAVLLIDELDRGTNKILCLQGVVEGKPVLIKKIGEVVNPAPGFTVIATANTQGRGSDDGRYAASILDDAFLERFIGSIEQPYPSKGVETRILKRHMETRDIQDTQFAEDLVNWADTIRTTYENGGVDDFISTRRLCHIVHSYGIFGDRMAAINICINRFSRDTRTAFAQLFTKVCASTPPAPNVKTQEECPF